jgi:hypothetical protein
MLGRLWITLPYAAWWRWSRQPPLGLPRGPGHVGTVVRHARAQVADARPSPSVPWHARRDWVSVDIVGEVEALGQALDGAAPPFPALAYIEGAAAAVGSVATFPGNRFRAYLLGEPRFGPGRAMRMLGAMSGVLGVTVTETMGGYLPGASEDGLAPSVLDVVVEAGAAGDLTQTLAELVGAAVLTREPIRCLRLRQSAIRAPA